MIKLKIHNAFEIPPDWHNSSLFNIWLSNGLTKFLILTSWLLWYDFIVDNPFFIICYHAFLKWIIFIMFQDIITCLNVLYQIHFVEPSCFKWLSALYILNSLAISRVSSTDCVLLMSFLSSNLSWLSNISASWHQNAHTITNFETPTPSKHLRYIYHIFVWVWTAFFFLRKQ